MGVGLFAPPNSPCGFAGSDSAVISGTRTMGGTDVNRSVGLEASGGCASASVDKFGTFNNFQIAADSSATTTTTIMWEVLSTTPGAPVSFAGDPYITFLAGQDGGAATATTTFTFTICTRGGPCVNTSASLTGNTGTNLVSLYAPLLGIGLSQAQLADIEKVTLVVEGGLAYDIVLDQIVTGIPEPGTLATLGAGLVALGLYRRRKR